MHFEARWRAGGGGRGSRASSAVRLLRCIADVIPSFKRILPRGTVCAGCAASTAAAPVLAWSVIVRSVAPRGGESRHGTKRSVVTRSSNTPPQPPRSRSLFAVVRCVGVLTSIDYGITRGTRRLMAYYYQPREGIGDEVVADQYRRMISGRLRGELDGSTLLPSLSPFLALFHSPSPASASYIEVCFIQIVIAHLRQQSGFS